MKPADFLDQLSAAVSRYDRYVVCIDKDPDAFRGTLLSLIEKAIGAYNTRGPGMRHGIALDKWVTVILSQSDKPLPLCGIYFNLWTPYTTGVK